MRRREFLRLAAAGAAAVPLSEMNSARAAETARPSARDRVTMARCGLKVSRLALGTGTHGYGGSSNQTRQLGPDGLADLLHAGVRRGLNFWDCADSYGSHAAAARALRRVGRDRVVLMTKSRASTGTEMAGDLERFRAELGVDVIDIVLLHGVASADWPERKREAMTVLAEAKTRGFVRAVGVSCHGIEALRRSAETDWVDIQLARVNSCGLHMDADPTTVLDLLARMKAGGKGVIGMKILGQGDLREQVDACLEYALTRPELDCVTIGCESIDELDDLMRRMSRVSARTSRPPRH